MVRRLVALLLAGLPSVLAVLATTLLVYFYAVRFLARSAAFVAALAYPTLGELSRTVLEYSVIRGAPGFAAVTEASKWAAVGLTLLSGSMYLWRNREVYLRDM